MSTQLIQRIERLLAHWERMAKLYQPDDIRGPMFAQLAKDLRETLDRSITKQEGCHDGR